MKPGAGWYRRSGADLPFADLRHAHGVDMEGWFWRFSDPVSGHVVVALIGVCQSGDGPWALTACALHPQGIVLEASSDHVEAALGGFSLRAGSLLEGDQSGLSLRIEGLELDVTFARRSDWPVRWWGGLGPAHWVPGIGQHWHPHLLGAEVWGGLRLPSGEERSLDGWRAYGEKNWGGGFPTRWWWGQAQGFTAGSGEDACLAFAGGELPGLGSWATSTAVVLSVEGRMLRFGAPTGVVSARARPGAWHLRCAGARHRMEVRGEAASAPYALPVPIPAERRTETWASQHLAGEVEVILRRGRRLLWRGRSELAGLEYGEAKKAA